MLSHALRVLILIVVSSVLAYSQGLSSDGRLPTFKEALKRHGIALSKVGLMKALRHHDSEVRYLAAQELVEQGIIEALPAITKALRSEQNLRARINIAYALAQAGAKPGFTALQRICHSRAMPSYESMLAADYLLRLGDGSCNDMALAALRPDAVPSARIAGMYLLRQMRDLSLDQRNRALSILRDSLFDHDISVRITASDTLLWLKDEKAIPVFERAIAAETNPEVRSKLQADLKRIIGQMTSR